MSREGIKIAAKLLSNIQQVREELIRLGSEVPKTKFGQQDILLGQMLRDANDAIKERFNEITMMETEDVDRPSKSE
jgi:hypothetical protein